MTIWIGINRLRQILPRFTFRIPACERGLKAVSNYRTVRTTSTGLAVDEPVHDWSSHAASALKVIAEAEAAHMFLAAQVRQQTCIVDRSRFEPYFGAIAAMLARARTFRTDSLSRPGPTYGCSVNMGSCRTG